MFGVEFSVKNSVRCCCTSLGSTAQYEKLRVCVASSRVSKTTSMKVSSGAGAGRTYAWAVPSYQSLIQSWASSWTASTFSGREKRGALSHSKNRSLMTLPTPTAANGNARPVPDDAGYTKRLGCQAAIDPVQVAAAMEPETQVGSNVKKPFPSATSGCSGFNRNGFVSELGSATAVACPAVVRS